jgi:hypothetical protein
MEEGISKIGCLMGTIENTLGNFLTWKYQIGHDKYGNESKKENF